MSRRTCPICGAPARYVTCGSVACRQAHRLHRQRHAPSRFARRTVPYDDAYRAALDVRQTCNNADVERRYQAARAARLNEERRTGQRTHTIPADSTYVRQDGRVVVVRGGWQQRPGAGTVNFGADEQGDGWS